MKKYLLSFLFLSFLFGIVLGKQSPGYRLQKSPSTPNQVHSAIVSHVFAQGDEDAGQSAVEKVELGSFDNPYPNKTNVFGSDDNPGGLIMLLNAVLRIVFLLAGIYTFINFFIAGFQFVNARGDTKKIKSAWFKIWQSFAGLLIMITSFITAVILGQLLFGDPGAILNLKLFGAG